MKPRLSLGQLAELADCATPTDVNTPGARWLRRVADEAAELLGQADDPTDAVHEAANAIVPSATTERWRIFVDLAAYEEDIHDYGPEPDDRDACLDLTGCAGTALFIIAERLMFALVAGQA